MIGLEKTDVEEVRDILKYTGKVHRTLFYTYKRTHMHTHVIYNIWIIYFI